MRHRRPGFGPSLMALLALLALLASLALLPACEQEQALEAYELSGRVTVLLEGEREGDAIAGARIVFVSDTLIVAETTTAADGRYRMRLASDHRFGQVRAEAEGFRPNEATVFFDTPQRRVDLALRREL